MIIAALLYWAGFFLWGFLKWLVIIYELIRGSLPTPPEALIGSWVEYNHSYHLIVGLSKGGFTLEDRLDKTIREGIPREAFTVKTETEMTIIRVDELLKSCKEDSLSRAREREPDDDWLIR